MKFILDVNPVPKARHRTKLLGRRIITYDPQHQEKMRTKRNITCQMSENKYGIFDSGPLDVAILNFVQIPQSLSPKKQDELDGTYCDKRPDIDNYCKNYFDIMNTIAYKDDGQIASLSSKKIYSKTPRVEIVVNRIGNFMINEHAVTVKGHITQEQIAYLAKKANRLGLQKRQLFRVYTQDDEEGSHVYFETEALSLYGSAEDV